MSIEVQELNKYYGDQKALDDVTFSIGKGEIVGFLGPNGAGKSTLMKILTSYLVPSSGTAIINGHRTDTDSQEVKKVIGYLPENNPLYTDLYVKEYLAFQCSVHKVPKIRIQEIIAQVGLEDHQSKKISQLSKGYKQRVGLAAALVHDPEVLVLDEPTTGLDPNQLLEIRELIRSIGAEKTILLSTHIMQEVEAMCDRVILIDKGKMVTDRNLKQFIEGQEQTIQVEFDLIVEEALIRQIPELVKVDNIDMNTWNLTFQTEKDMRSEIFDFANRNGLKALQISRKRQDLESLFRELTNE